MEFRICHEMAIKKGDNVYTLHVPVTANVGELLDVAFQILDKAKQLALEAAQKAAPQEVRDDKA